MSAAHQLRVARPSWRQMAPGLAFGVLSGLSAVLLIGFSAYLITRAAEQPPILYLGLLVVGVRAFALSRGFFRYMERLSSHDAAFRALGRLRIDAFTRLEPLAPTQLGRYRRGDLLTRLVTDVDQMVDWPTRVIQPLVTSGTVILLTLLALTWFSPAAAGVLALALLLALLCGTVISAGLSDRAECRTAGLRGRLADEVAELVGSLDVLVAYGAVEEQLERVRRADDALWREAQRASVGAGLVSAALTLAAGGTVVMMLMFSVPQLVAGDPIGPGFSLSPGTVDGPVLAVLALVPLAVFELFAAVPLAWTARRRVLASAQRLVEIAPPGRTECQEFRAGTARRRVPGADGEAVLELREFTVHWPQDTGAGAVPEPVSRPVSVRLRPGENLLITGPSGAGKTALAYGLMGFLEHRGAYLLGEPGERSVEVSRLSPEQLRRRVCLIEQDAHIFDSTLRANLSFAHPQGPESAEDSELREVLQAVGLWEWAQSREGLDTEVGMFGSRVSGGQAQRIAVARGLLSGAEVLILDEPTAHVDPAGAEALLIELLGAARDHTGPGHAVKRSVVIFSHLPIPAHLVDRHMALAPGS